MPNNPEMYYFLLVEKSVRVYCISLLANKLYWTRQLADIPLILKSKRAKSFEALLNRLIGSESFSYLKPHSVLG